MRRRAIKKLNREYFRRKRKEMERAEFCSMVRFCSKKAYHKVTGKRVRSVSKIKYYE